MPINLIDMTKSRKRIGSHGAEKLFKINLMMNVGEITEKEMRMVIVDSTVQEKNVTFPTSGSPNQSYYEKRKARKKFCKRTGIEPVIGHPKTDHRMMRNYLRGTLGDTINTLQLQPTT